jgi:dTDP-4-dehydrorhamnose reductase
MASVLVLGGKGMLGAMMGRVLAESSDLRVEKTVRTSPGGSENFLDVEKAPEDLATILNGRGPFDYLINCVGVLKHDIDESDSESVRRAIRVNALWPHQLGAAAREHGARTIHISTDAVFSRRSDEALFENSACDSADVYGKTKSLGEVIADDFLTFRASIVGPDPVHGRGLWEWFRSQPNGATLNGFVNQIWTGVTTLQFARLCRRIILENAFDRIRGEAPIHHLCPNRPLSKCDLLEAFKTVLKKNVNIAPAYGTEVRGILRTRYSSVAAFTGSGLDITDALSEICAAGSAA